MHICVSKLTIIGPDNGLSPGRRQAIIWINDGILLIGPLGTNLSEILIEIIIFSVNKMHLKISSGNWQPFCLGLNVLSHPSLGWLYVFSAFPPPTLQRLLLLTSKLFELNLRYIGQRKYRSGKMYWMTFWWPSVRNNHSSGRPRRVKTAQGQVKRTHQSSDRTSANFV